MNNEISLSLETSGRIGSIAISRGTTLLEEIDFSGPLRHGAETLPAVDCLFQNHHLVPSSLETIYVSAGPGSFTGIRLAVTMAKTMAYALNARIVAVPSLEAQVLNAESAREDGIHIENIAVVLEAGRGKVFATIYKNVPDIHLKQPGLSFVPDYLPVFSPEMVSPEELINQLPNDCCLIGEGLRYHQEEFSGLNKNILVDKYYQTKASFVFNCGLLRRNAGLFTDFDNFVPIYMRKPEAELNLENAG